MENDYKKLPVLKPLLAFLTLIAVLTVLFFIASAFSKQRKQQVYDTYARETEAYISRNKPGLQVLFNEVFIPCTGYQISSCTSAKAGDIPGLVSSDLKDWSSTMFAKLADEKIYYMRLSGDISIYYSSAAGNEEIALRKLLSGEVNELPWDNYSYQLPNKEVVIAVKDDSGKIIGAIIRGVIE